ncbi:MAG: T9SS type A sorting domain-containing protein [Deferribacteres bacterium]|nr:T9SS type A sorting domain-containing protein [candidate division KSB1 bacterium]MCB9502475.1 T9SS type A sorting domain-containing protein [Deferribacteres bacterium]
MKTNGRLWLSAFMLVFIAVVIGSQFDYDTGNEVLLPQKVQKTKIVKKPASEKKKRVKGISRHDSPGQFAEYHRLIRTRDGENAPDYPNNYRVNELLKARNVSSTRALAKTNSVTALEWTERGPGNVSGRTRAIVVDPDDPNFDTWYVGSVGGGIWKTANAGRVWTELTKDLPNLATSVLVMSKSNPNIMYAGTGEGFGNTDQIDGSGIWKSSDRGQSWEQLTSTANNDKFDNIMRLVVDPANPNILVVATAPGFNLRTGQNSHIMRSENGGQSWTEVYSSSNGDVEDLVANPKNFKTQYAAINSVGVIKSIDGGKTWSASSSGIGVVGRQELAVSPVDTAWIFMSCEGKNDLAALYVSVNSGQDWVIGNDVSGDNINWLGEQGWYDNAIAAHPYEKQKVFVGGINLWNIEVKPNVTTTGPDVTGIDYENTNAFMSFINFGGALGNGGIDYGELPVAQLVAVEMRFGPGKSQKAHRFLVPEGATSGVPAGNYVYQDYVEVPFEVWDITNNQQLMVSFRDQSRNGTWELSPDFSEDYVTMREYLFFQKEPYNATTPHPSIATDGGHAYKQLYFIWPVLTSGGSFDPNNMPNATLRINYGSITARDMELTNVTDGYGDYGGTSKGVHVDHHRILLVPTNTAALEYRMINGNDGGIWYSDNEGLSFTHTLYGYNTTQFYGVDKMHSADRYIGGTQDNGSWFSPVDANAGSAWADAPSGDGFEAVWHYNHPDSMLETSQFNNIFRSTDGGSSWHSVDSQSGMDDSEGYPFITRLAKSNIDPDLVFASGGSGLWRTDNFASTWRLIDMPEGFVGNSSFSQVEISQATPQVVWAGYWMGSDDSPYVSRDGGITFEATAHYTQTSTGRLSGLATHPTEPGTAYLLFAFAKGPKIVRTTDYGQNWQDISGFGTGSTSSNGFPDVAVYDLVCMPHNTDILWAGTEIGIFESTDGGASWAYADNNLPAVAIWQMRVVDDEVVVATHGRGVWSVTIPELANYELPDVPKAPRLTSVGQRPSGEVVALYSMQSAFDSTQFVLDGSVIASSGASNEGSFSQGLTGVTEGIHALYVQGFKQGTSYRSPADSVQVFSVPDPRSTYIWDFNFTKPDFIFDGFSRIRGDVLSSFALQSPHPYEDAKDITAMLRIPIKVDMGDDSFSYDDIAIIELGEEGTVFGDEYFYDYVVVEGSKDGVTWIPLEDGYDSSADAEWQVHYKTKPETHPTADLFVSHTLHLRDTFAAGDKIFIRFRLHADPATNAWGWVIDNLSIQPNATGVEETDALPEHYELSQNYPNPFNPETMISYALPHNSEVSLYVFNVRGQKIKTLVQNEKQQPGRYKVKWDGLDDNGVSVASGLYFYKLQTEKFVKSRKMSLIR